MPTLRALREADFQPKYQSLYPPVQEKVCLIEFLYERAMIYLEAREKAPAGVPNFDSYLRDLYKNMAKVSQKDPEDEAPKVGMGAYYLGLDYEDWAKILGDSRYRPHFGNLSHTAVMLSVLWIYWMTWPYSRRIFEEEKKISLSNIFEPDPVPSAPSFEATLDRSLVWLALSLGEEMANTEHWAKKREGIAQYNLKVKKTYISTDNKIVDAFYAVPKKKGDYFNSIVNRIYTALGGSIAKKTIERHLQKNLPLMEHNFSHEQRGGQKRLIYIGHAGV